MTQPKEPITLYGSKAERFRAIKDEIKEETGMSPTNPEVVYELIKSWDGMN